MILSIIGAVAGLGSAIAGGVSSAKQAKKQDALRDKQKRDLDYWYKKEKSEDFFDSDIAKSTLNYLDQSSDKLLDSMHSNIIKNNSTAEGKVALASALNNNYASNITALANSAAIKQNSDDSYYLKQKDALNDDMYQNLSNKGSYLGQISAIGNTTGDTITSVGTEFSGLFNKI